MGAVYEVEHEHLGVRYALKAFSTQNKYADVLKKKFLAEGKVLARLRDPHLIRVFDLAIDEATDVPYFVMDIITYKDGTPHTLEDVELDDLEEFFGWDSEPKETESDPMGQASGSSRIVRGGSWCHPPSQCHSSFRCRVAPTAQGDGTGFRLACPAK